MSDHEHSFLMLKMARKDLRAIESMKDKKVFADEIFGFHTQQAAEKFPISFIKGYNKLNLNYSG